MDDNLHPSIRGILRYFAWEHLPAHLREVSKPFGLLARALAGLPEDEVGLGVGDTDTTLALLIGRKMDGPELTVSLRKLLEAKDAAVRAALD